MKHTKGWQLTLFGFYSVMLLLIAFMISSCERGGFPTIVNQRDDDVTIYVTLVSAPGTSSNPPGKETNYGVVPAHTTKELASITFVYPDWVNRIEAKNPYGKVVFSHDYKMTDLEKIGWKITIPP